MLLAGNGPHVSQPMTTGPSSTVSIGPSTAMGSGVAMDATKAMTSLRRVMQSGIYLSVTLHIQKLLVARNFRLLTMTN